MTVAQHRFTVQANDLAVHEDLVTDRPGLACGIGVHVSSLRMSGKHFPDERSPGSSAGKARRCLGFRWLSFIYRLAFPFVT
jgi:hypothetical protein